MQGIQPKDRRERINGGVEVVGVESRSENRTIESQTVERGNSGNLQWSRVLQAKEICMGKFWCRSVCV